MSKEIENKSRESETIVRLKAMNKAFEVGKLNFMYYIKKNKLFLLSFFLFISLKIFLLSFTYDIIKPHKNEKLWN